MSVFAQCSYRQGYSNTSSFSKNSLAKNKGLFGKGLTKNETALEKEKMLVTIFSLLKKGLLNDLND